MEDEALLVFAFLLVLAPDPAPDPAPAAAYAALALWPGRPLAALGRMFFHALYLASTSSLLVLADGGTLKLE